MAFIEIISWAHLAGAVAAYAVTLIFYRLTLHPLARYPGPRLAAATRLYEGYYDVLCNGQYTFKIAELHKKYGPIIRISPHELHIHDPENYEVLFNNDGKWLKYSWTYDAFYAPQSSFGTVDHDHHKHRRAAISSYFSKANVARKQDILQRSIAKLCSRIGEYTNNVETINLSHAMSALSRDVAAEFLFDEPSHGLDIDDFDPGMTNVFQSAGGIWRVSKHLPWFGAMTRMVPPSTMMTISRDTGVRGFFKFLEDIRQSAIKAAQRGPTAEAGTPARALADQIMNSSLPESEKSVNRLNDEIGTVSGAAFETTANTLCAITYHVYTNEEILYPLREEITAFKRTKDIVRVSEARPSDLEQLPFLTLVLMEGLRLSPGLATRTARIAPDRDLSYRSWSIPAGTPVSTTTYLMHIDENVYPEPMAFKPQRWAGLQAQKAAIKTFAPFAKGPRACLGMHLAWAELYMVAAALVDEFDFEFVDAGPKDVVWISDQFVGGTADTSGIKARVRKLRG